MMLNGVVAEGKELCKIPGENPNLRHQIGDSKTRLTDLMEASRRITATLDAKTVLNEVLESARSLTAAQYGVLLTHGEDGAVAEVYTSGMTDHQQSALKYMPSGKGLLGYLNETRGPLRIADISSHPKSVGFPANHPPMATFLGMQIRHGQEHLGNIFLTEKEHGAEFTEEDEETIVMLVSLAAVAIANARKHEDERRARKDLETLLDIAPVGVAIFDAKTGRATSWNQEVDRQFGSDADAGTHWEDALHQWTFHRADGRPIPLSELPTNRVFQFGETVRGDDCFATTPDGRLHPLLLNAAPIFSEQREITGAIVVTQDLAPLVDSERLRSEFVGLVSEELRIPLATVKGSVAALSEFMSSQGKTEGTQLVKIIDQQVNLMRSQVNSLLELSYIESGTLVISPDPTDVDTLADGAVREYLRGHTRIDIQTDIPDSLPRVMADRQRICQVLNNLLFSVDLHAPDASCITVSASQSEIYVNITVSAPMGDFAGGEPTELLQRMLGSQANDVGKVFGGEKLALDLCRGIVEAHGGRLHVENEDRSERISYSFTIPIAPVAVDDVPVESDSPAFSQVSEWSASSRNKGGRILVATDDARLMGTIRRTLTQTGYTPIVVEDFVLLERMVQEEDPDLLVLDLPTRRSRGLELTRQLSGDYGLPIIVLSGQGEGEGESIERAFEMGADDYIVKPFSPTELIARIMASLRKRSGANQVGSSQLYQCGAVAVDYEGRTVTVSGSPVHMTATEYNLLVELSGKAGRVVTQDELLERVWGPEYSGESQLLRSYVKSLRQKLGDNAKSPSYIFTEHGIGYRMQKPRDLP